MLVLDRWVAQSGLQFSQHPRDVARHSYDGPDSWEMAWRLEISTVPVQARNRFRPPPFGPVANDNDRFAFAIGSAMSAAIPATNAASSATLSSGATATAASDGLTSKLSAFAHSHRKAIIIAAVATSAVVAAGAGYLYLNAPSSSASSGKGSTSSDSAEKKKRKKVKGGKRSGKDSTKTADRNGDSAKATESSEETELDGKRPISAHVAVLPPSVFFLSFSFMESKEAARSPSMELVMKRIGHAFVSGLLMDQSPLWNRSSPALFDRYRCEINRGRCPILDLLVPRVLQR